MAHRTGRRTTLLSLSGMAAPCRGTFSGQPEESQPIPARARNLAGNGAQRAIASPLMLKAFGQDFHRDGCSAKIPVQNAARRWDASIVPGPSAAYSSASQERESIVHN